MNIESKENSGSSNAIIQTQNPQRIMNRLCKHWAHKLPVTLSSDQGEIKLPMGICRLYCTDLLIQVVKREKYEYRFKKTLWAC